MPEATLEQRMTALEQAVRELQEALAAIRKNGQLDMIRAKWHRAEGEQVDLLGSQFGEHLVRLPRLVLDLGVEVFHRSNTEWHRHRLPRGNSSDVYDHYTVLMAQCSRHSVARRVDYHYRWSI